MATYKIESTSEEREAVLNVLEEFTGTISVKRIAIEAGILESRARNALLDLEESKQIKRIPTKAINKHFVRYRYEVLQS